MLSKFGADSRKVRIDGKWSGSYARFGAGAMHPFMEEFIAFFFFSELVRANKLHISDKSNVIATKLGSIRRTG